MQRKTKITLFSILAIVVVIIVALIVATPFILNNIAKKQTAQLQAEIEKDIAEAALTFNVGLFPKIKDLGDAYEVTLELPDVQEIEVNTEVADQKLILSGKLTVTVNRESNGYTGTASSSRDFSFSLGLRHPVNEAGIITKQEEGKIIVIVPKLG